MKEDGFRTSGVERANASNPEAPFKALSLASADAFRAAVVRDQMALMAQDPGVARNGTTDNK
ncbi:hypothetical protein CGRA01v4_03773 [Colletotrichum graminicola]|nr:hypothetical protein CGRA01v4_03773 [Colletotrichum graminicola]